MAQAVRRSPSTAGVPSSRLGSSMWVSWWTKRDLGRFFSGFLPFSPTTNFIPPFLHTHLTISFHFISPCDGASGVVGRHPCYSLPTISGLHRISSLDPTLCWTRVEDILFILLYCGEILITSPKIVETLENMLNHVMRIIAGSIEPTPIKAMRILTQEQYPII